MTTEKNTELEPSILTEDLLEKEVIRRYKEGATNAQDGLCCPTSYDPKYLKVIPDEIITRDYGCGDPSEYVRENEVVLDLGSGGGKICYILSQKVGSKGKVIGVDFNDDMLALARQYKNEIGHKIGYKNVEFHKGKIQDLALSLDKLDLWLNDNPINSANALMDLESEIERLKTYDPMIPDNSIDVIVSNCVLNLVKPDDKAALFHEMYRVLKKGGRAVISDIVCDEDPTPKIMNDPKLWSACVSGAFREDKFLNMFEAADFYGIEILKYDDKNWQTIDGIEFRSITVQAYKGKQEPCFERNQAVIYKGPWSSVTDDDGHIFPRGQRIAVCDKTYNILVNKDSTYTKSMQPVPPLQEIPLDESQAFDCSRNTVRHPKETKGENYDLTTPNQDDCYGPDCKC